MGSIILPQEDLGTFDLSPLHPHLQEVGPKQSQLPRVRMRALSDQGHL